MFQFPLQVAPAASADSEALLPPSPLVGTDPDDNDVTYLARALRCRPERQLSEAHKDIDVVQAFAKSAREKKRTGIPDFLDRNVGEAIAWVAHSEATAAEVWERWSRLRKAGPSLRKFSRKMLDNPGEPSYI